ncbi:MAG: RNA polymerase-associated protein RapA [Nitrosomonadaceae bacterium]|nr:RNA polymerase-associated protein RapA [Nitrosomonadaceae bacterium]
MQLNWKFNGTRVLLVDQTGASTYPSAQQVFSCAFAGSTTVNDLPVSGNPLEKLSGLTFSRYPADPAAKITGTLPNPLQLAVGVVVDGEFSTVNDGEDQVVIASRWYPIDLDSFADAAGWLSNIGIQLGSSVTIGQLIAIRGAKNPPFTLFDETSLAPVDVAAQAGKEFTGVPGLDVNLYPYQRDGIAFLQLVAAQGVGCILADEMGLGKTLQIIGLLQSETNAGRTPSLVVATATMLENWRREIRQFAPKLSYLVHAGALRAGITQRFAGYDVIITSFDTAIRDETLLSEIQWNLLILDEAQAIKNPEAQRTKAVKRIHRRVSIAVTGTPVENCLGDLWSLSDFVLPGLLGTVDRFRAEFTDDVDDAGRLAPVVAPILLRRRVADVAQDLPPKIEIPQPISMSRDLAELYETVRTQVMNEYGPSAGMVATTKLRLLCAHPSLNQSWDSDPSYEMPKYQRLIELLGEIFDSNEKALVFTSYQAMSDLLMRDMPSRWPNGFFQYIDGRISVLARQPTVDDFYDHKGFGALFLNPKAAGTGLNITTANHVIHYNPEWNPALTAQATARAYRRKQERPVTIHHLFFADSVEEVMIDRAEFKQQLADGAVTGHEGDVDPSIVLRALQISPLSVLKEIK